MGCGLGAQEGNNVTAVVFSHIAKATTFVEYLLCATNLVNAARCPRLGLALHSVSSVAGKAVHCGVGRRQNFCLPTRLRGNPGKAEVLIMKHSPWSWQQREQESGDSGTLGNTFESESVESPEDELCSL